MKNKNIKDYDNCSSGILKALPFPESKFITRSRGPLFKFLTDWALAAKCYLELVSGKYPNLRTDAHKYNFFIANGYTEEQWKTLNETTIFEIVDIVEAAFGKNGYHLIPTYEMDVTTLYPKFCCNQRREKTMDDVRDPITTITDKIMSGNAFNLSLYESDAKAAKYYLELREQACHGKLTYSGMRNKFIQAGFTSDQWHKFIHMSRWSIIDFVNQMNSAYDLTSKLGLDCDGDVLYCGPITSYDAIKLLIPNAREENKNMKTSEIKNVIFNEKATVVYWADGTKTVVHVFEGEKNDPEKGLAIAIVKKAFGNKGNYYDIFKQWLPKTDPNVISNGEITEVTQHPDESENKYFTEMTVKEFCRAKKLPAKTVYNMIRNVEVNARKNKSGKWLIMVEK